MTEQCTEYENQVDVDLDESSNDPPETLSSEQLPAETSTKDERMVPVSESRRYRRRAQSAERRVSELEDEINTRTEELARREQQLNDVATQRAIDHALHDQQAIDIEVAGPLIQLIIDNQDDTDIETAVHELRRRKPFLFRHQRSSQTATTLGPRPADGNGHLAGKLEHAAEDAIRTGKRVDLLRYLSLRRSHR